MYAYGKKQKNDVSWFDAVGGQSKSQQHLFGGRDPTKGQVQTPKVAFSAESLTRTTQK